MKRTGTNISAAAVMSAAALLAAAVAVGGGGCRSEPAQPSQSTKQGNGSMKEPAGMSKPQPGPAVAAADLTHVVTKDSPYYKSSPAQGRAADGTFRAGTKVLLLMPMGSYSQVQAENGVKGYVATEDLRSLK